MRHLLLFPFLLTAAPLAAEVPVPSGQPVALFQVLLEPETQLARFRFLAPDLGGDTPLSFAEVEADFAHLCATYALPALNENDWPVSRIVISLASAETEFGVAAPDVVQYFEGFVVEDGQCTWEVF